jgi:hypothetical protein
MAAVLDICEVESFRSELQRQTHGLNCLLYSPEASESYLEMCQSDYYIITKDTQVCNGLSNHKTGQLWQRNVVEDR